MIANMQYPYVFIALANHSYTNRYESMSKNTENDKNISIVSHLFLSALGLTNGSDLTLMGPSVRAKHQTFWV